MPRNNVTKKFEKHIHQIPYDECFTDEGFSHFRTYFGNVKRGQSRTFTAPFAKGRSMEKVLQDWDKVLVSIKDEWPTLYDFENDLAKKVGPLSIQKPLSERMEDIAHYYDDILLPSKPVNQKAIKAVLAEFSRLRGLRLRPKAETVERMKKSTSAGAPFMGKRRDQVPETVNSIVNSYFFAAEHRWELSSVHVDFKTLNKVYETPAIVGWRGQEGGPSTQDVKQRVIWMFPFAVNMAELRIYQPLIEAAQRFNLVPAWVSMESVDHQITLLFDTKSDDDLIVCTDFSKFDQHFNSTMQETAETILRGIVTPNMETKGWFDRIFPIKYNIPLIVGVDSYEDYGRWTDVHLAYGPHGMASGSGGTNADETLAHRALQYEAAILKGQRLNPHSQCLGDDGILSYPGITVDDVVAAYKSHGQECNIDKQYASTQDCVYLRRWHHQNYRKGGECVGVYSTMRALGRLRYLERFMDPKYWSEELVALRQLSIIENCKWHPLFHEFIEFCMKRDKFRLGLDIPGFLDNIESEAKKAIDHMPDFLGYTKTLQGEDGSGILGWEVVKYLKSKR